MLEIGPLAACVCVCFLVPGGVYPLCDSFSCRRDSSVVHRLQYCKSPGKPRCRNQALGSRMQWINTAKATVQISYHSQIGGHLGFTKVDAPLYCLLKQYLKVARIITAYNNVVLSHSFIVCDKRENS